MLFWGVGGAFSGAISGAFSGAFSGQVVVLFLVVKP